MKLSRILFSLALLVFFSVGCNHKERPQCGFEETPQADLYNGCRGMSRQTHLPLDPFGIDAVSVSGHCLNVDITFSGGCENHFFDLYWDGTYDYSGANPAITAVLHHDSNGDLCKALANANLGYNLAPTKLRGYNSITVNVVNYNGGLLTTQYNY